MKKVVLILAACMLLVGGIVHAQDPGIPDSIILDAVHVDSLTGNANIQVYAVTDDSVMYYNTPIGWFAPMGGVHAMQQTQYYNPLLLWDDNYDSLMQAENYMRMFGFSDLGGDDNPPLITNGQRLRIMTMRFVIDPPYRSQLVVLDTVHDFVNGSISFGLIRGSVEFAPQFQHGFIAVGATGVMENGTMPNGYALGQNYPNPFNPETNIDFAVPTEQNVTLTVYNLLGQEVRTLVDGVMPAGVHTVRWDGTNSNGQAVPSGVYFYKLHTDQASRTNKMVMLR